MRIELLVDSEEFWRRLQEDLEAARSTGTLYAAPRLTNALTKLAITPTQIRT